MRFTSGRREATLHSAMCRMLGIVVSEPTDFRLCLHEAPRSLCSLSREHPHGWGVAVHDSRKATWAIDKQPACAGEDSRFTDVAAGSKGDSLIAHVRKRTVGPVALENTHPFHRGRWVFAHNGTINDVDALRIRTSTPHLAQTAGSTDSEAFFAYLLTRLDDAGGAETAGPSQVAVALAGAVHEVLAQPSFGACNFLLSNGAELYALRHGRTLWSLTREPGDFVRVTRRSGETGAVIETPWTPKRHAVLIASERITDEPWEPVEEATLLRVTRGPTPALEVIRTH